MSLRLPPLRERPGDIEALADHYARRFADMNGVEYRPLSRASIAKLAMHGWRGNVRELENTLHRAVLLATGDTIGPDAIELAGATTATAPASQGVSGLVGRTMEQVERDLILETLGHTSAIEPTPP